MTPPSGPPLGPAPVSVLPVTGIGEVGAGDDLAALITGAAALADGDIVVVTSKVVSKAEGRVVAGSRDQLLPAETDRVVARRGSTSIVRSRLGLVMAAAGIDGSNVEHGNVVLLPEDPDTSARRLRDRFAASDLDVAVVVSDTSGRAWRGGQTDIAVGAAGLAVLDDHAGRFDGYGNPLAVTAPATADEIAGAADLVKGKLRRVPVAVVRGLGQLVLPRGTHGPGAVALVRSEADDLFGLGAREAVLRAVLGDPDGGRGFGAPASAGELTAALSTLLGDRAEVTAHPGGPARVQVVHRRTGASRTALSARTAEWAADLALTLVVARAHRWTGDPPAAPTEALHLRPDGPPGP